MEYQVWLGGSDGKNYLVSYAGLQNALGICELVRRLEDLTREVRSRLEVLEKPQRKERVLTLLKDGSAHTWGWLVRRVPDLKLWDREELSNEGKIVSEWHGKVRVWKLKETPPSVSCGNASSAYTPNL
jgi:hypothetical protein